MTTPRGKVPLTESTPNGGKAGASRSKASSTQKIAKPGAEPQQDLADTAAQLAGGAEAAHEPGPFAGLGTGEAIGALRFIGQQAVQEPLTLLRDTPGAARELLRIALGKSQVAPKREISDLPIRRGGRTRCTAGRCRRISTTGQGSTPSSTVSASRA
jgi:hypothetical protein